MAEDGSRRTRSLPRMRGWPRSTNGSPECRRRRRRAWFEMEWRAPHGQTDGGRVLSVLFGYPLGSALIGWAIDRWAGSELGGAGDAVPRVRRRHPGSVEDFKQEPEKG